jgi:methylmalonyl-CoA mutase N-terminal domain/subunit
MTDEVEAGAVALMRQVEDMGGAVAAIEKGFQKSEIEQSAYSFALGIDSGERVVVGLNRYRSESEERYEPLRVDPSIEADQRERLRVLREKRDQAAVDRALADLKTAAAGTDNVMVPMRVALKELATVGEVCGALREVWGVYKPQEFF